MTREDAAADRYEAMLGRDRPLGERQAEATRLAAAIGLSAACSAAGIVGSDQDTSIRAYVGHGPMATEDRERMASMSQLERDTYIATRWGSDGARVANIVRGAGF